MPVRFMADGPSIFRGPTVLRGRRSECAAFDALLAGMRGGRSGVLLVSGEAGVGKTALLEYAVESASDVRVLRAVGVESENGGRVRGPSSVVRPDVGSS
jgi:predicted ATP-dependent serine protease